MFIILAGEPRSGKDTISRHWAADKGIEEVHPGHMIRDWAAAHEYPLKAREDFIKARAIMIEQNPDVFLEAIVGTEAEHVCVNGLRVVNIARILQSDYHAKILALECDPWRRFQRSLCAPDRAQKTVLSYQDFLAQDAADHRSPESGEAAMATIMRMADYTIRTGVSQELMLRRADDFLDSQLAATVANG